MRSTVRGCQVLAGGRVGGIIRKDSNNVRCSVSESKAGQLGVSQRRIGTAHCYLLLSIASRHEMSIFMPRILRRQNALDQAKCRGYFPQPSALSSCRSSLRFGEWLAI